MKKILMCFSLLAIMQSSMGMEEQPLGLKYGQDKLWKVNDNGEIVSLLTQQQEDKRFKYIKERYKGKFWNTDKQYERDLIYMDDEFLDKYFSISKPSVRRLFLKKQNICVPAAPAPVPPAGDGEQPIQQTGEELLAGNGRPAKTPETQEAPAPAPVPPADDGEHPMQLQVPPVPGAVDDGEQLMRRQGVEEEAQASDEIPMAAGAAQVVKRADGYYVDVNVNMPPVSVKLNHDELRKFQEAGVFNKVVNSLINVARSTTQTSSLIYCISHWLFNAQLSDCIPVDDMLPGWGNDAIVEEYSGKINGMSDVYKRYAEKFTRNIRGNELNDFPRICQCIQGARDEVGVREDIKSCLNDNFVRHVVAEYRQTLGSGKVNTDEEKREALREVLQAFISAYYASGLLSIMAERDQIPNYDGNGRKSAYRACLLKCLVDNTIKEVSDKYKNPMLLPDNVVENIYKLFLRWE